MGSIHKGEVKRIEAYGVFVALPGYRKYGLVHASQVKREGVEGVCVWGGGASPMCPGCLFYPQGGGVKRIEAYGVFVALPAYRKYGLVHASQVMGGGGAG